VLKDNIHLGKTGEEEAAGLLKRNGYRIIHRNYRTRSGEIDIIARDKDTICFVEVKARRCDRFGLPEEAISAAKKRQISKAALKYLQENDLLDNNARFDVVSILYSQGRPEPELIKDAFELDSSFTY